MAKRSKTAQAAYDIAYPVAEQMGLDLVDAEYKKEGPSYFLRLFIDRKGGVGIDECEEFSRVIDPILDEKLRHDADYFEVSSPGLTRPLTEIRDYIRYEGEKLELSFMPGSGLGGDVIAKAAGVNSEEETVIFEKEDGEKFEAKISDISKAVRHIEF